MYITLVKTYTKYCLTICWSRRWTKRKKKNTEGLKNKTTITQLVWLEQYSMHNAVQWAVCNVHRLLFNLVAFATESEKSTIKLKVERISFAENLFILLFCSFVSRENENQPKRNEEKELSFAFSRNPNQNARNWNFDT